MRSVLGSLKKASEIPLLEVRKSGIGVVRQRDIVVVYYDVNVGEFMADLLVEDQVIVELKVVGAQGCLHVPQCRNDLRATGAPLRLLITSAGPKLKSAAPPPGPDFNRLKKEAPTADRRCAGDPESGLYKTALCSRPHDPGIATSRRVGRIGALA
jgi:GxxExxY protein